MFMYKELRSTQANNGERGAGVVEWLAISALSVGLIVGINTAFDGIISSLIDNIRSLLGVQ